MVGDRLDILRQIPAVLERGFTGLQVYLLLLHHLSVSCSPIGRHSVAETCSLCQNETRQKSVPSRPCHGVVGVFVGFQFHY